jgi:hypothetical protein
MMCSTAASSCDGTATRTISHPDAVSSAICCSVALMFVVGVVVGRDRDPDDLATRRRQFGYLLQGGVDVGRHRGGHRLHGHRRVAADADTADVQLPGLAARGQHGHDPVGGHARQAQTNGRRAHGVRGGSGRTGDGHQTAF